MKKKTKPRQSQLGPSVSLTREDLDEIVHIISTGCEKVTIEDGEYIYASLDELEKHRGQGITKIEITGSQPYIAFEKRLMALHLYASGEDSSLGPYLKLRNILDNRKRPLLHILFNSVSVIIWGLVFTIPTYISSTYLQKPIPDWVKILYTSLGVILLIGVSVLTQTGGFSRISLHRRHEQKSFWSRNKDTIIITVITNILTAIFSFVVAYLLFRGGIK